MRNISFSLTTRQVRNRTKTVTRRIGWKNLKPGDRLMGCVKCMGLKLGEKVQRISEIVVVSAGLEPLKYVTQRECEREGFPEMTPAEFIAFFCKSHRGCTPETEVTRIEFRYVGYCGVCGAAIGKDDTSCDACGSTDFDQ